VAYRFFFFAAFFAAILFSSKLFEFSVSLELTLRVFNSMYSECGDSCQAESEGTMHFTAKFTRTFCGVGCDFFSSGALRERWGFAPMIVTRASHLLCMVSVSCAGASI
jgi:hypothetical protein